MTHEQAVQSLYDIINDPFSSATARLMSLSHIAPDKYRVGLEIIERGVWTCVARSPEDDRVCYSTSSIVPEQAVLSMARMWYGRLTRYHGI